MLRPCWVSSPTVVGASTSLASSVVERLAGDLAAAERELRRDCEALTELGEKYLLSSVAAELARVLYDQEQLGEAEQMSHQAQEFADADDIASQTLWRTVYARILSRNGKAKRLSISCGKPSSFSSPPTRSSPRPKRARRPSRGPAAIGSRHGCGPRPGRRAGALRGERERGRCGGAARSRRVGLSACSRCDR